MLYPLGIILIVIVAALTIANKISGNNNATLDFEDEMDAEELKKMEK